MGCFKSMGKSAFFAGIFAVTAFAATVNNPIMYVDSPDPSIVRVDDAYYMVTTTMHFAPGVPVFKSTDLAQWRTVGYAYQTLTNNDQQNLNGGKDAYGKGSWASSIRYHKGFFYSFRSITIRPSSSMTTAPCGCSTAAATRLATCSSMTMRAA